MISSLCRVIFSKPYNAPIDIKMGDNHFNESTVQNWMHLTMESQFFKITEYVNFLRMNFLRFYTNYSILETGFDTELLLHCVFDSPSKWENVKSGKLKLF